MRGHAAMTENRPFSGKITIFCNFGPLGANEDIKNFDKPFDYFKAHIKRQRFLHCHIRILILSLLHGHSHHPNVYMYVGNRLHVCCMLYRMGTGKVR